jgi:hypothetical protein
MEVAERSRREPRSNQGSPSEGGIVRVSWSGLNGGCRFVEVGRLRAASGGAFNIRQGIAS